MPVYSILHLEYLCTLVLLHNYYIDTNEGMFNYNLKQFFFNVTMDKRIDKSLDALCVSFLEASWYAVLICQLVGPSVDLPVGPWIRHIFVKKKEIQEISTKKNVMQLNM